MALQKLFEKYDRIVIFDTETTGLQFSRDEIIEFSAVVLEQRDGEPVVIQEYDELITLSPGSFVPPVIQKLTGITDQDIRERGVPKIFAGGRIESVFGGICRGDKPNQRDTYCDMRSRQRCCGGGRFAQGVP